MIKPEQVIKAVAEYYNLSDYDCTYNTCQDGNIIKGKHMTMYILNKYLNISPNKISKYSHCKRVNIWQSINKIQGYLDVKDEEYIDDLNAILINLKSI
jgi:chromosomal replication initiation ATPase DnaA